jgi:hypothetical protein
VIQRSKTFVLNLPININEIPTNLKLVNFYLNNENYGKLILNLINQKYFLFFDFNITIYVIKNKIFDSLNPLIGYNSR